MLNFTILRTEDPVGLTFHKQLAKLYRLI